MSDSTRDAIYDAIAAIRLIDPHTHINPHSPASSTLADLLGYHYYTELAHSAGMPKEEIEEAEIGPRELVRRLVENLGPLDNTAQYGWLIDICQSLFGFDGDRIDSSNWETVYESAEAKMDSADWAQTVLDESNVEAVFLTNDFDDDLSGFDTDTYIPCLRTDDLVFHLAKPDVRGRLEECSGVSLDGDLGSLRDALVQRFTHFVSRGARACAISLPPDFSPTRVSDGRAETALQHVLANGELSEPAHRNALSRRVFWTLAELCDHFGLPFDLMIGVNRGVYADGVYQGQDLYDSRVSLTQYRELFNSFPNVKFPISVLASVTNQELVSHAWIFPNVITNGHWWYSNTPSFIARDTQARLEAVPKTKQIGYYSDAYKLEFIQPKFDMYRNVLADVLHDHFVAKCGWSEERAIELGHQVLRGNVDEIFPRLEGLQHSSEVGASEGEIEMGAADAIELGAIETASEPDSGMLSAGTVAAAGATAAGVAAVSLGESVSFDDDDSLGDPDVLEIEEDDPEGIDEVDFSDSDSDDTSDSDSESADVMEPDVMEPDVMEPDAVEPAVASVVNDAPDLDSLDSADDLDDLDAGGVVELDHEFEEIDESEDIINEAIDESDEDTNGDANNLGLGTTGAVAGSVAALAAGAIGMVEVDSADADASDDLIEENPMDVDAPMDIDAIDDAIDPNPSEFEIDSTGASDVELSALDSESISIDADTIEDSIDPEPLDVGDVFGEGETELESLDEQDGNDLAGPEIQLLRGEESFAPDDESLQLVPDPVTGELTFPTSSDDDGDFGSDDGELDLSPLGEGADVETDENPSLELPGGLDELPAAIAPELQEQLGEAVEFTTDDDGEDGAELLADFFENLDKDEDAP